MKPSFLQFNVLDFFAALLLGLLLVSSPVEGVLAQTETPTPTTPATQLTLTAVQPNSVSNTVDTVLIVTGGGFIDGAAVVIEGSGGLLTVFVSDNLLRAVLPAGTNPGTYTVTVVNPDATSTSLPNALRITSPAVGSVTPNPTNTPAPTAFVRPLLVVSSYGASSAEITPSSNLDFEMTIANAGSIAATNIVATFVPGNFVPRATGGVRALGNLDPGQLNRFWQPLFASGDLASGGIATLEVKVDYTDVHGTAYSETFSLTFPVVKRATGAGAAATATPTMTPTFAPRLRPQLIVTGYDTGDELLQPGVTFMLSLTVQNQGNADAERVTMIVGGGSAAGGAVDGTPSPGGVSGAGGEFSKFAPVGASNVQTLGNLVQGSSLETEMAFIVNAATEAGAYPMKVSFVYEDAQNGNFVDDQVITLLVTKRPSVIMNFYAPLPPLFVGEPGSLPLQVVNTGNKSAVLGNFSVSSAGATIENGTVFVGNLEPGGFYPLDAVIFPAGEGAQVLDLSLSYTDDFGQAQAITQTLEIEVMPPMVFEEPTDIPVDNQPLPESAPETNWQKVLRFLRGLLGLSSGVPEPVQPQFGPPQEEGGFDPVGPGPEGSEPILVPSVQEEAVP